MKTEHYGSYFIRPNGIIAGGWVTDLKGLSEQGEDYAVFGQLMESVYKTKGQFAIDSYAVRLFLKFSPENSVDSLRNFGFGSVMHSVFGDKTPSDIQSLKFSTKYIREKFSDSIELEASLKDVQLRYSRESVGTNFSTFRMFLNAVNFKSIVDDLRPLCEPLVAAEPRKRLGNLGAMLSGIKP